MPDFISCWFSAGVNRIKMCVLVHSVNVNVNVDVDIHVNVDVHAAMMSSFVDISFYLQMSFRIHVY